MEVITIFAGPRLLVELERDVVESSRLGAPHEVMPQQKLNRTVVRLGIVTVQIETADPRVAARQCHVSSRAALRLDDSTRDDGLAHQIISALEIGGPMHPLAAALWVELVHALVVDVIDPMRILVADDAIGYDFDAHITFPI